MKIWVNADDFGFSKSCTDAIFTCFKKKMITSTTACANGECFDYAVSLVRGTPYFNKVGIHINLTEGKPLSEGIKTNPSFCDNHGYFNGFPNRYSHLTKKDKNDIYIELKAQFEKFLSTGMPIHHIDSHHHIHNSYQVLPIVIKVAGEYGIKKIRRLRNVGKISFVKRVYKKLLNNKIKAMTYSDYMGDLDDFSHCREKKGDEIIEIMIHPDYDKNGTLINRTNDNYESPTGEELDLSLIDVFKLE